MRYLVLILLFITNIVLADEVQVSVFPKEPVVGESFNVTFNIVSNNGTDPIINFNPSSGLEVMGREEAGVRTSTSYINGKLSVERSVSIVYEMIATTAGSKYLRNISVDLNGNTIKARNVRIPVLKTARKAKNILALAVVDKEEAFVGESILVRYYLYNKVPVNTTDIKKFPKLDKFLKRYHQERMRAEKVRYNGEIYTRRVLYTAQLFADKAGEFKIDPIQLKVQYYANRNNPYSGLSLNFRKQMSTTISSKSVKVKVKPLPTENIPKYFTGLVGKHEFSLRQNKSKFLVNDPIELKFTVKGKGALELFESPNFLDNPAIEEFDATNDLVINSDFTATKTFNITHLGRAAAKIPESKLPLSYFDPDKGEYVTVYVELKPITIAGSGSYVPSKEKTQPNVPQNTPKRFEAPRKTDFTPIYKLTNSYIYRSKYINYFLIFVLLLIVSFGGFKYFQNLQQQELDLFKEIKKDGADFGRLHGLVSMLGSGSDMRQIVTSSKLNSKTKKTLLTIIERCEQDYAKNGVSKKYKIKAKDLKHIFNYIKEQNEHI